jgi:CheY-like chemotaxis protein
MLIMALLDRLGVAADLARDGAEAIELATAARDGGRPYDLVLMDMQMPVMDGLEATRQLRALGHDARRLPILALTANAYADDVAASLGAGMQAHLAKPLRIAELSAAIRRWARRETDAVAAAERFGKELRERYRGRRAELLQMVADLAGSEDPAEDELRALGEMLHKFLGTAEMFGDADLASQARALEDGLEHWPSAERTARLRRAAEEMKACG